MTIKKRLSGWVTAAMAGYGAVNINAFGFTKELKAPRRPKSPKTLTDYEAMHAAEMKHRRKAKTCLRNQHNQEA